MPADEPKGVIAIITSPDGYVMATHADFDHSGFGGFKTWEAQRHRAVKFAKWALVKAYASPAMTDALEGYDLEQIAGKLLRKGHRLTLRAVGWPDDVQREIEER